MRDSSRFGVGPLPGDLRIRHILLVPFIVYGVLNMATVLMVMGGAPMKADAFWHWPAIQFFSLLQQIS